jgi:hypothetical protein
MITLKLKYEASDEAKAFIRECRRQYSSALRFAYNRVIGGWNGKRIRDAIKFELNNVGLMDSYMASCAEQEASAIFKSIKSSDNPDAKYIFGGRGNFIRRCKGLITKEAFDDKRLSPLLVVGEANCFANRKFRINNDFQSITFQINKNSHYTLNLIGIYGKRRRTLEKLYELQCAKATPITYKLDSEYVYLSFDETQVEHYRRDNAIQNRVMAIDMNPNYIGWSVVDWKGEADYNVIRQGVFSVKPINDIAQQLSKSKTDSSDPKKIYVADKRLHEAYEVSKKLIRICLHYRCEMFATEDLDIRGKDCGHGKKYNRLVNNNWCRNSLELNLQKRCNIFDIKFLKVKPNYSSFVGNFVFRHLNLPDMVLASIEIGRRGYEFNQQYIEKKKDIKRNIVFPDYEAYRASISKSLEEFGLDDGTSLLEAYDALKKSGVRYRLSFDRCGTRFSRCFSKASLILKSLNGF